MVDRHMSSIDPACTPVTPWEAPSRSPLFSPPSVGLSATLPQYAAGRIREPPTWEPRAMGTMRAPTTAADPLEDPPGVRPGSNGLVVLHGVAPPSSVVVALPSRIAP